MLETMGIYVMGVIFGIAIFTKTISYVTIRKMVKAASEIHKSNHKFMKLIKAKFEHASMVSDKVQNVEAFVEKYLYEHKILGIKMDTFRGIPMKALWIIALLGAFCALTCYRSEGFGVQTLKYMEWTAIFILSILLLRFLWEEESRIKATKNYIVEYLENVCVRRYEKASLNKVEEISEPEEEVPEVAEPQQRQKTEQEIRIRAILEEFLA